MTGERVTILAEDATPLAQLSRAEGERRVVEAEAAYTDAAMATPEKREAAMQRLLSARAMVTLAEAA